jgi:hypothetical protein
MFFSNSLVDTDEKGDDFLFGRKGMGLPRFILFGRRDVLTFGFDIVLRGALNLLQRIKGEQIALQLPCRRRARRPGSPARDTPPSAATGN